MFPEKLLHFIWQTRRFDAKNLQDTAGNSLKILHLGKLNPNQGADFLQAKIEVGGIVLTGDIELHIDSGEWYRHGHHLDEKYNAVILHVVYRSNGAQIFRQDMSVCPEIVLENRIDAQLLKQYALLQKAEAAIPCEKLFPAVAANFQTKQWIESLGVERMAQKSERMRERLQVLKKDWEQVIWENLLVYMCGQVNAMAAQHLAELLPFSLVKKYASHIKQVEALLFGAARLLKEVQNEEYTNFLQKEWAYLQAKHDLQESEIPFSYLRMRAANFPDIRLAQVAAIVHQYPSLSKLLEIGEIVHFVNEDFLPSDYWKSHYRLGKDSILKEKPLGKTQKQLLLINLFAPLGFLYRKEHGKEEAAEWVIHLLAMLPAEKNSLTEIFTDLGFKAENALHSQGLIACKTRYCEEKRCLFCGIGNQLLR